MAYAERASSFLPTIKCSMCAQDIEISLMGDHICSGPVAATAGEPTPPPDSTGNFDRMPYKQNATNGPSYLKPGRAPPPRVDTNAANRPFYPQDELTPVSASPSRSMSPMSDGQRSPFMRPLRSATAPVQRAPPSPELLSSNLDSAFPPFPGTKMGSQRSKQGGGYGGMGKTYAEPDSMYAPISPRTATSGGILQRMNTIAPGPFDGRRKANEPPPGTGHRRNGTGGSLADATMSSATAEIGGSINRPSTAGGHSRTSTNSSNGSKSGIGGPRNPRKPGYGGFGPPTGEDAPREPLSQESRSQTFPLKNESSEAFLRRPSEPRMRRPSNNAISRMSPEGDRSVSPARERRTPSISGPDLTRAPPPRGVSLIRPRVDARLGDAPPVPNNLNLAAEFGIGNPYHTPTESSSSNASGYSDNSKASSRSSPPRSRRRPSDATKVDALMADLESSMADMEPRKMSSSASPPRNRNQYPRVQPQNLAPSMQSPESPMDPAIQFGRLSPAPPNQSRSPSPLRSDRQQPPLQRPTANRPTATNRPNTANRQASSKGNCKGCSEPIKGKSVSSADGRLTGRYHKQCFVCKTCAEPFQTATFYVIDDSPYCERHYHKLNGSVCRSCNRGIEGQYLESERKEKFHPGCLTCADCKRNLRHDYFEMNGRVYCERDAFRRAQTQPRFLGPGGGGGVSNRMERRTTRLMMM
ncbi:hypothetical protein VTL71DRAFT_12730 [Oculimacula yallundae]|uniref:LIM zinc-binding domain-containing protein n=1 Tax=Oculimacula yallundae TaxID=86028 RepID=A0ABR4CNF1_9HELO